MMLKSYKGIGRFPEELMDASPDERKRYFSECFIRHKHLDEAVETTLRHIESYEPESIILVCGPSGVGKKEFIREITSKLVEAEEGNPNKAPGNIPVVSVEARAPEEGSFRYTSLWADTLKKMSTPMLDCPNIDYQDEEEAINGKIIIKSKPIKADYQTMLHHALMRRHVKAYIINEAHHMCRVATEKKANWALDVIKSLANNNDDEAMVCETAIVLVGTYDLLNLLNASANFADQIHQRVHIVDFPRYHEDNGDEMQCFGKTAKKLLYNMPFERIDEKFVEKHWKYLYAYSLGCIGTLKRWFLRAYAYALQQQATSLTKEHLEATKLSGMQIDVAFKAIKDGEASMARIRSDGDIKRAFNFYDEKDDKVAKKEPTKRNAKPFERKPVRDKTHVGLVNVVEEGRANDVHTIV
jgi:hypothetical protein